MSRKRGFFAEMARQGQIAQKQKQRAATVSARANAAAGLQAERAGKQAERAHAQLARATVAEQKQAAQEAARLQDEAMHASAAARTAEAAQLREEMNSILSARLRSDPFVDLEKLRKVAAHPPFARTDLEAPVSQPMPLAVRDEPRFVEPPAPKGLSALFSSKTKHAQAVAAGYAEFTQQYIAWQAELAALPGAQLRQMHDYQRTEQQRLAALEEACQTYRLECEQRESEIAPNNAALDDLIHRLAAGKSAAVCDYVGMVLDDSAYPDGFAVDHEVAFDQALQELTVSAMVLPPNSLPVEKEFKYVKSKMGIAPTSLSLKEQRDRYLDAICQVALRTLHEAFTADRQSHIKTIALTVATHSVDKATGLPKTIRLIAVAAERSRFLTFHLASVTPLATLQLLGALVSKNPFDLIEIDASKGVRGA